MVNKNQKYDRQLRLWKEHGQKALENAHICLLNGSATGSETLKNLVLPGIGRITIVDEHIVQHHDLGNNFFLDESSLGRTRSKSVVNLLRELNEDVQCHYSEENFQSLMDHDPDYFKYFDLVIAAQFSSLSLEKLANYLWEYKIPLVLVRSFGFFGYLRIIVPEHPIFETHPEKIIDLRIDRPFKELGKLIQDLDWSKLDSMQLTHLPYILILGKCLDEWRQEKVHQTHQQSDAELFRNNALPTASDEKAAFKNLIESKIPQGSAVDTENFQEALSSAYRAWTKTSIPSSVSTILNDSSCINLNSSTDCTSFWILCQALKRFCDEHGVLPLAGTLPDMKADTNTYVQLQKIYHEKGQQDIQEIQTHVQSIHDSLSLPIHQITNDEVSRFCKHASCLKVFRFTSLKRELENTFVKEISLAKKIESGEAGFIYYVLFRVVDQFLNEHKRYPGEHQEDVDGDILIFKKMVNAYLSCTNVQNVSIPNDFIQEFVRAGASELHNIAAFMGGIAAQECIKILTKQYVPMNNTLIYDGIKSSCHILTL